MRGFGKTDRGLCREINQDSFSFCRISDTLCYAVLCDGMGGENGGNVASELTVRDIGRELSAALGPMQSRRICAPLWNRPSPMPIWW